MTVAFINLPSTWLTFKYNWNAQTLKRLHEEQMRGLYVSEQQKQSEMRGEYTSQTTALTRKITHLDTQIQVHKEVSFLILEYLSSIHLFKVF